MTNENESVNDNVTVETPKFEIGCSEDDVTASYEPKGREVFERAEIFRKNDEAVAQLKEPRKFTREHSAPPPMVRTCQADKTEIKKCKSFWEERIQNHAVDRLINPFSEFWGDDRNKYRDVLERSSAVWKNADKRTKLTKADDKYGLVVEGTLTAYRGNKAKNFIANNIIECCETIKNVGYLGKDGLYEVKFGTIFKTYERINDKLVGLLVRARRHGLVDFPGEMLYQRQDDDVIIKLLKIPTVEELELKYMTFDKPSTSDLQEQPTAQ